MQQTQRERKIHDTAFHRKSIEPSPARDIHTQFIPHPALPAWQSRPSMAAGRARGSSQTCWCPTKRGQLCATGRPQVLCGTPAPALCWEAARPCVRCCRSRAGQGRFHFVRARQQPARPAPCWRWGNTQPVLLEQLTELESPLTEQPPPQACWNSSVQHPQGPKYTRERLSSP